MEDTPPPKKPARRYLNIKIPGGDDQVAAIYVDDKAMKMGTKDAISYLLSNGEPRDAQSGSLQKSYSHSRKSLVVESGNELITNELTLEEYFQMYDDKSHIEVDIKEDKPPSPPDDAEIIEEPKPRVTPKKPKTPSLPKRKPTPKLSPSYEGAGAASAPTFATSSRDQGGNGLEYRLK